MRPGRKSPAVFVWEKDSRRWGTGGARRAAVRVSAAASGGARRPSGLAGRVAMGRRWWSARGGARRMAAAGVGVGGDPISLRAWETLGDGAQAAWRKRLEPTRRGG